jgi:hypothetical protein
MSNFYKLSTGDVNIIKNKKSDVVYDNNIFEEHNKIYYKVKYSNNNTIKYVKNNKYDIDIDKYTETNYVYTIFDLYTNSGYINRSYDDDYPKFMIMKVGEKNSSLSENIDKFIEIYIGKFNKQPLDIYNISMTATSDTTNIMEYLELELEKIKKIRSACNKATELQNILDEIMGNINQCKYLLNLH